MTPRERVLTALRLEMPDRIPWIEGIVDDSLATKLCGEQISMNWDIAPDGRPPASGARLAEMQKKVCRALGKDNINIFWAFDDVAFNSGPMFSPDYYRETVLPIQQKVAGALELPLITHSDGNMTPILDDWLKLGQQAIHPLQPDVMDINQIKAEYGDRVALVGNIFMDDLVQQTPEEITAQVCDRIEKIGVGGGYVISSSNSLTADMKPENVSVIREAIHKYGEY